MRTRVCPPRAYPSAATTAASQRDARAPDRPIVPSANVSGHALMCVIAIMSFLACLPSAASAWCARPPSWQSQISREITIQIKPTHNLDMERALADARDLALTFNGTTGGTIIDRAATRAPPGTVARWWTRPERTARARLVVITIDESNPPISPRCERRSPKRSRRPFSMITAPGRSPGCDGEHDHDDRHRASWYWSSRNGADGGFRHPARPSGNRHIVEVLHFVGAEASFVAAEFPRSTFCRISLKGAGAGGLLAALSFALASFCSRRRLQP